MTRELLQEANKLNHSIADLEAQIRIVGNMHHCDSPLRISCIGIGSVTLNGFDELKDDIIDIILDRLTNAKDNMEDNLRLL